MSVYSLTKGTITKVATSVTSRLLRNLSRDTQFLAMEKATGETAPTAADIANEGYYIFTDDFLTEKFNFDSLSDIYIMAMNGDGKIRVDALGKPRVSSMPYLYDISEGNVDGHVPFSKLGYTPSLTAAANTDLWSYAPTQPVYLFPTAAMQMEVLSSDNTADIGTIIKSGTSTGGSLTTLIDTAKDFTAATAVAVGDAVILDLAGTSPEYGYVTAVTSATQLTIAGGFSRGGSGALRGYTIVDKSAYAGAQAVEITYLDGSYAEKREIMVLNGSTVLPTVNTNIFRVNNFRVVVAGVNGIPTGNLTIRHLDNTPVYSYITAGFNRARNAMYTVPAGKTLYLTNFVGGFGTSGSPNKEYARITPRANMDPTTGFHTNGIFYPSADIIVQNTTVNMDLPMPFELTEKTDVKVSAIASANGAVSSTFIGWLEENE